MNDKYENKELVCVAKAVKEDDSYIFITLSNDNKSMILCEYDKDREAFKKLVKHKLDELDDFEKSKQDIVNEVVNDIKNICDEWVKDDSES